jgi:hypothetical protein
MRGAGAALRAREQRRNSRSGVGRRCSISSISIARRLSAGWLQTAPFVAEQQSRPARLLVVLSDSDLSACRGCHDHDHARKRQRAPVRRERAAPLGHDGPRKRPKAARSRGRMSGSFRARGWPTRPALGAGFIRARYATRTRRITREGTPMNILRDPLGQASMATWADSHGTWPLSTSSRR